jgi:hypothetical protein
MSVLAWPNLGVSSFRWKQFNQMAVFRSGFGSQAIVQGSPLWEVDIVGVPQYWNQANQAVAFFESFGGYTNQLEMYNLTQPVPRGTMRGAMTFAASAAQGAGTIQIAGGLSEAGKTLLKGDLIGFGSGTTQQVVRIMADATADGSGVITVTIGTPLRNAFTLGASITWNKPKALFRQKSLNDGIEYQAVIGQPWSLSLVEDWRP